MEYFRCFTKISLKAIVHNFEQSKRRVPEGVKLMAVIKADAYGHGAVAVARALQGSADAFAVATLEEGIRLRNASIKEPILLLSYTSPKQYPELLSYGLSTSIYSPEDAELLSSLASEKQVEAGVHIALDTGMSRIGFSTSEDACKASAAEIRHIIDLPNLQVEGIFSHFSCADMEDKKYSELQKLKFKKMKQLLEDKQVEIPCYHFCNSAGVMEFEDARYDMVRLGITLYGCYPSEEVQKERLELIPALSWYSHVVHVKEVEAGVGVGYGATYVTNRPRTKIATVSVGYADGYPRALSNKGRVLIHGISAPILGRVCMDQIMVDVTGIDEVKPEDVVTLVGRDGDEEIKIEEIADASARFNYEMLCDISQNPDRVHRIYVDE